MIYIHGVVVSMENVDKGNFKKILSLLKSSCLLIEEIQMKEKINKFRRDKLI
jgi:hypothetical protein